MSVDHVTRGFEYRDLDDVIGLSLRAWEPVFASFESVLGPAVFRRVYPDWRAIQARAVVDVCTTQPTWVATVEGRCVGFVAVAFAPARPVEPVKAEPRSAEIEMIAVEPGFQRRGIAAALIALALERMRQQGVRLAVVATGGDQGHAPARAAYEKAGFTALPLVRYYRAL